MELDVSMFGNFLPVFVFVLIFTLLYALLEKTKLLGSNSSLNFLISMSIAFISLFSGNAMKLVLFVLPWYIFLMVFLVSIFSLFLFYGMKEEDFFPKPTIIFIVMMIFLIIGITKVFGPVFTPYVEEGTSNVLRTIFHPRVFGAFFILLISSFLIKNISENV